MKTWHMKIGPLVKIRTKKEIKNISGKILIEQKNTSGGIPVEQRILPVKFRLQGTNTVLTTKLGKSHEGYPNPIQSLKGVPGADEKWTYQAYRRSKLTP